MIVLYGHLSLRLRSIKAVSAAASQCALGRRRDEFISFAAAALADGSGAVDSSLPRRGTGRKRFLIAGSFVETRSRYLSTVCCFV